MTYKSSLQSFFFHIYLSSPFYSFSSFNMASKQVRFCLSHGNLFHVHHGRHLKNRQFFTCLLSPPNLIQIGQQQFSGLEETSIDNIKRTQAAAFSHQLLSLALKTSISRWWNPTSHKPWVYRLRTTRSTHHALDSYVHIWCYSHTHGELWYCSPDMENFWFVFSHPSTSQSNPMKDLTAEH